MSENTYVTDRFVLRPGTGKTEVTNLAGTFGWPLLEDTERDQEKGIDGLAEWEVPALGSFFYCEDADFGIPYIAFGSISAELVDPLATQVRRMLKALPLAELLRRFDDSDDQHTTAETTLLLGIAAPTDFTTEVFARIRTSMDSPDENIRWIAVWATTYTGYDEFIPSLAHISEKDPFDWVRDRARTVLEVFEERVETS